MIKIPEKYKNGRQFNPSISSIVTVKGLKTLLLWLQNNYNNMCGHKIQFGDDDYADPIQNSFNFINSQVRPELKNSIYSNSDFIMDYVTTFSSFELMYYLSIELKIEGFEYSDSFINKIISHKFD